MDRGVLAAGAIAVLAALAVGAMLGGSLRDLSRSWRRTMRHWRRTRALAGEAAGMLLAGALVVAGVVWALIYSLKM